MEASMPDLFAVATVLSGASTPLPEEMACTVQLAQYCLHSAACTVNTASSPHIEISTPADLHSSQAIHTARASLPKTPNPPKNPKPDRPDNQATLIPWQHVSAGVLPERWQLCKRA